MARGGNTKSCENSFTSCQSVCLGGQSSSASSDDYGWLGYVGGLLFGGGLGLMLWMLADQFTSEAKSQYVFLRNTFIVIGVLFIAISYMTLTNPKQSLNGVMVWNMLSFWLLPAFFLRFLFNDVKMQSEQIAQRSEELKRSVEIQQHSVAISQKLPKPRAKRKTSITHKTSTPANDQASKKNQLSSDD